LIRKHDGGISSPPELPWAKLSGRRTRETDRHDKNIHELKTYFNCVIDWVSTVFRDIEKEMQALEWGRLYEQYHSKSYDPAKVSAEVKRLYTDPYVKNRRGIFEYILGGLQDSKLLDVRVFDEATKIPVVRSRRRRRVVFDRESWNALG
jgi:hypothetical protein